MIYARIIPILLTATVLASCASTSPKTPSATQQILSAGEVIEGDFIVRRNPSGTGGLRRVSDKDGNGWSIDCQKDAMTDKRSCQFLNRGIFVYYGAASSPQEVCAFGHSFPGRTAQIRVGSNAPLTTDRDGCIPASRLLSQLKTGSKVTTRVYTWPYDYPVDKEYVLDGFEKALEVVQSIRSGA